MTRFGTICTIFSGLGERNMESIMSRLTQSKDPGQEAHNIYGLKDEH
jgi:hypothetical protein